MKQVKKEIFIAAPAAKVWEHITDPKKIVGWLMPNNFEPVIGREFSMDCGHGGKVMCLVKELVPTQKLVYSFRSEGMSADTLVTITLVKEGKGTRLTLIHTGWEALPPGEQGMANEVDGGWGAFLQKLQEMVSPVGAK